LYEAAPESPNLSRESRVLASVRRTSSQHAAEKVRPLASALVTNGHTPAIAGTAQSIQRPSDADLLDRRGPIDLMLDAARAAADDAGAPSLLEKLDWVAVVGGLWRFTNPGQLIAAAVGSPDAATALSAFSGSSGQDLVGIAAERIARGEIDVALVVGGEARWTEQRLKREGATPRWSTEPGEGTPEALSPFANEMMAEMATLGPPAVSYALFEDSLRASRGESIDTTRDRAAALWAAMSDVAATNPFAWDQSAHSVTQVRDVTADNRMIAFPYTKAMVANNTVDMASAVLLCSVDAARAAGVADDRLVFPLAVTVAHETWQVVNRDQLHGCPALTTAGHTAFKHAGITVDDVEHVDLYACFPSIVQMSANALGLSTDRPLTVTGGLGFAGAPLANSTGQSIAAIVPLVRGGGYGLVHGNGGMATKHAFGVYGTTPPDEFRRIDCQDDVMDNARAGVPDGWSGDGTVEAATVVFDREGPSYLFAAMRAADGARAFARSTDDAAMAEAMKVGVAGQPCERTADGELRLR
jgi:acetyl-CoA C-acetyltransferase